jgi:hypothetical protein
MLGIAIVPFTLRAVDKNGSAAAEHSESSPYARLLMVTMQPPRPGDALFCATICRAAAWLV